MGIAYSLVRVPPQAIEHLRGRPRAVAEFLYGDPDIYEPPKQSVMSRLFGSKPIPDTRPVPTRRDDDEDDLDKAWHIVHYLLTGSTNVIDSPLNLIANEGDRLADIDLGYGPPFVISPETVAAFSDAAHNVTDQSFLARLVPEQMPLEELYLGNSVREDPEEMGEYALEKFHILRGFADKARANGEAIITYYC